jgi:8-oxo-dGTP pyrophosphatase MutT (NUDIX family)
LRPRVTGAVVLVRVADELLLVRASYRPWLTVPGGRVARGEPPLLAAVRELHEEVGLRVASEQLRPLGEFVIRHSNLEDHIHAYELRLDERPRVRIDMREITWAGFRPEATLETAELWPQLPRLLSEGTVKCGAGPFCYALALNKKVRPPAKQRGRSGLRRGRGGARRLRGG